MRRAEQHRQPAQRDAGLAVVEHAVGDIPGSLRSSAIIARPSRSSMPRMRLSPGPARDSPRAFIRRRNRPNFLTWSAPRTRRRRRAMSPTMSSSAERPASRSNGRPCCSAPLITAIFWRSSLGGATSRSLNMAGSNFSKPPMSRMFSQSCDGQRTRAMRSRGSARFSYIPASARQMAEECQFRTFAADEVMMTTSAVGYPFRASSSAFASLRSDMEKPSVNQP